MSTEGERSKFPYKCVYAFNAAVREGGFTTIIMENSGIYKKRCVQMVCDGDGLGSALCVRARFSQSHTSEDHKSRIKALGHHAKCLLAAGGCGIVVHIPTPFECQPH